MISQRGNFFFPPFIADFFFTSDHNCLFLYADRWYLGIWLCEAWLSIDYTASTSSILNLLVLSLDRYWSITTPLKYLRQRTKRRAFLMIATAWLISLLWIFPVTSWHRLANSGIRRNPAHICETEFVRDVTFKVSKL